MNELAIFAGAGGGILGGHLLGWRTICAVEWDAYAASVLVARQNDGTLPPFPVWDDVQTFDGRPWRGRVDVISGGFPCQDISAAGKGAGITGERSGMWKHMARIIHEVRPRFCFLENSPMLASRGLGVVLGDLAEMGFNAEWCVLGASDVGAPHRRKRIWILAYTLCDRLQRVRQNGKIKRSFGLRSRERGNKNKDMADALRRGLQKPQFESLQKRPKNKTSERAFSANKSWWATEPRLGRVANGVANRVDRIKCLGNGQVPAVAATAFKLLSDRMK